MKQLKLFFTALMFLTRIPVPKWVGYSEENINKCNRYFPLVGGIIGIIGGFVFLLANFIFPQKIAIILSMSSTIILTGAFHEDGFADFCDGFGGGMTKEKILEIMKDSRMGAYGTIGMILILLLKFFALSSLPASTIIPALICGHSLSRTIAVSTMYSLPYVREDELSKSKPVTKNLHISDLWIAIIIGVSTLLLFKNWSVFIIVIPVLLTKFWFDRYLKKRIGGYVGDCLGAMQQVSEIVFYLSLLALPSILKAVDM